MTSPGCRIGDFMWNHLPQGRCTPILIIDFAQNQAPLHKVQPKALHCRSLIVQISTTPHSHVPLEIDEIIGILTPANNCSRKSCSRPSLHSGQPKKLLFMVLKRNIERIAKKCQKKGPTLSTNPRPSHASSFVLAQTRSCWLNPCLFVLNDCGTCRLKLVY